MDLMSDAVRKSLAAYIVKEQYRLNFNEDIFFIMEGNIKTLLEKKMLADLGEESFKEAWTRETPINIFEQLINKQSRLYNREVIRSVQGPNVSDQDKALLSWYEETLDIDKKMNTHNEKFNAFQYALLHIALNDVGPTGMGKPFIRSTPNHHFLVYNEPNNPDPSKGDAIIICMGKSSSPYSRAKDKNIYAVYTNDQYIIMDSEGDVLPDEMIRRDQDGVNPYGVLPFAYANGSEDLVMPMIQQDNKDLTLLIPLMLTDLNYAVKFQCFSVFVAIDIEDSKIRISPNAILKLKSDPKGEKPSFEAIKPSVDIAESLNLAASEMGLWLTTKGIRPGTVGTIGADTFASGISKIIDESDAYENEKRQMKVYAAFERDFWDRLMRHIHPTWVQGNRIENRHILSEGSYVVTKFTDPVPLQTRGQMVSELNAEVAAGFTTRKRAIKKLNPEMSDEQIQDLAAEIGGEDFVSGQ